MARTMYRLLYVAPLIVAIVNLCGYAQVKISSTTLLILALSGLLFIDISRAMKRGRVVLRVENVPVAASIAIFVLALICSGASLEDSIDYDGPGAIYRIITPYLMFFPCFWIVATEKITYRRLIRLFEIFACYGLILDLAVSGLQLAYLQFIDPSGAIFTSNERLNSVVQFDNIRIVGLFASGLDHGFYLTVSLGLAWVLSGVRKMRNHTFVVVVIVTTMFVYFTYTRTAYIAHAVLLIIIGASFGRRRFGMVTSILLVLLLLTGIVLALELNDVGKTVSGLANSRSLLNLQTLESRYGSWSYYQDFIGERPLILLVGSGILQSAFPFLQAPPPLIDNLYLSLVLYGGVFFMSTYLLYIFYYLLFFFRIAIRNKNQTFDGRLSIIMCSSTAITIMVGFSATVWDLLSIGLPISILWALGWSYLRYSPERGGEDQFLLCEGL